MNILIQIKEAATDREIREFTEGKGDRPFISHSPEESVGILSREAIDKAVVSIRGMRDAAILKHINEYYPDTEVVVIADKAFDDLIGVFRKGNYSVIHEPLRLSELRGDIKKARKKHNIEK